MPNTVEVPVSLLKKLSKATHASKKFEDKLEDFLLLSDPEFLAEMRQSRKDHLAGKTRSIDKVKNELCTD